MFPKKLPKFKNIKEKQTNSLPYALRKQNFKFDDDYTNLNENHLKSSKYRSELVFPS